MSFLWSKIHFRTHKEGDPPIPQKKKLILSPFGPYWGRWRPFFTLLNTQTQNFSGVKLADFPQMPPPPQIKGNNYYFRLYFKWFLNKNLNNPNGTRASEISPWKQDARRRALFQGLGTSIYLRYATTPKDGANHFSAPNRIVTRQWEAPVLIFAVA